MDWTARNCQIRAAASWLSIAAGPGDIVAAVIGYDMFIVPHTMRGKFYRAQVLRRRTSAARL